MTNTRVCLMEIIFCINPTTFPWMDFVGGVYSADAIRILMLSSSCRLRRFRLPTSSSRWSWTRSSGWTACFSVGISLSRFRSSTSPLLIFLVVHRQRSAHRQPFCAFGTWLLLNGSAYHWAYRGSNEKWYWWEVCNNLLPIAMKPKQMKY